MRPRTDLIIDLIVLAAYVVATNPVTTGTPVHEWLGIGAGAVCFVHLLTHWDWVARTAARAFTGLGRAARVNALVDALLLVTMVATVGSGAAVSRVALAALGHTVAADSPWHAIHTASTTALLAVLGVHVGLHVPWLVKTLGRALAAPWRTDGRPARRPRPAPAPDSARAGALRWARSTLACAALVAAVTLVVLIAAPPLQRVAGSVRVDTGSRPVATAAEGFDGNTRERVAVRTVHSLFVLLAAVACGAALGDSLKRRGAVEAPGAG